jgi:hypothetical protein
MLWGWIGPPLPGAVAPSLLSLDAILINRGDRIGWTGDDVRVALSDVPYNCLITSFFSTSPKKPL